MVHFMQASSSPCKSIVVFVEFCMGRVFKVEVKRPYPYTMEDVKAKISEQAGILPEQQQQQQLLWSKHKVGHLLKWLLLLPLQLRLRVDQRLKWSERQQWQLLQQRLQSPLV